MPLTDLTGTTWSVPSWKCVAGLGQFSLEGTCLFTGSSGGAYIRPFTQLYLGYDGSGAKANTIKLVGGNTYIYDNTFAPSLLFTITGGTDVTNTALIEWLVAYGEFSTNKFSRLYTGDAIATSGTRAFKKLTTDATVTNLSGTTWNVPSWKCVAGFGQFSLEGTCKITNSSGGTYTKSLTSFGLGYAGSTAKADTITFGNSNYTNTFAISLLFTITGGTDATNATLIEWLYQYGTLQT